MAKEYQNPDAILTLTGLSGAVTDIDEGVATPDGLWLTTTGSDGELRVSFPTPSANPNTGAGLQEFRLWLRKNSGGGGIPTVAAELYEGGTLRATLTPSPTSITSATGELVSVPWDAASLATADGSAVELRLVLTKNGGGPNARYIEVGAVEWYADVAVPGQTVTLVGVVSLEAHGTGAVTEGATSRQPLAIPSGEMFGLALTPDTLSLDTRGISTGEAFGAGSINPGPITRLLVGVPTAVVFGVPTLPVGAIARTLVGVAGSETFGLLTPTLGAIARTVVAIPPAEAFGLPAFTFPQTIGSIPSIASLQAFGTPALTVGAATVTVLGVATAEAVPAPWVYYTQVRNVLAIASLEAWGNSTLPRGAISRQIVSASGGEAFGLPNVQSGATTIPLTAIGSGGAMGVPTLALGAIERLLLGIASAEAVPAPGAVSTIPAQLLSPIPIASLSAVGIPLAPLPGSVSRTLVGIASLEQLGLPIAGGGFFLVYRADVGPRSVILTRREFRG